MESGNMQPERPLFELNGEPVFEANISEGEDFINLSFLVQTDKTPTAETVSNMYNDLMDASDLWGQLEGKLQNKGWITPPSEGGMVIRHFTLHPVHREEQAPNGGPTRQRLIFSFTLDPEDAN